MDREFPTQLTLSPIGYVRSESRLKFDTPRQPEQDSGAVHTVELLPGKQFELALSDLAGFERIWLLAWFHQHNTWRPRVMPPRGPAVRRGVFATRSSHRPNPIALTCTRLLEVRGLTLVVGDLDLTDGTPILDIKPYLPYADAFPDSRYGWVEDVQRVESLPPPYSVILDPFAQAQLDWLHQEGGIDLTERAIPLLSRDPSPHRTRRILRLANQEFRMACGTWRLFFSVTESVVTVHRVESGLSDLSLKDSPESPDRALHLAFRELWNPRQN